MSHDYDPYSDQVMRDTTGLYRVLRAKGSPVFLEKYNTWALARFEDIWEASTKHEKDVTFTAGQTPSQLLLGEMVPVTFATMDAPRHRQWRSVARKDTTTDAVKNDMARFRELTRKVLAPLLNKGGMNIYSDYTNIVFALNSGQKLGLPEEDALHWRSLIEEMLHREPGQIGGSSDRNQQAAGTLFGYHGRYVAKIRSKPELSSGHTKAYLDADIDSKILSDEAEFEQADKFDIHRKPDRDLSFGTGGHKCLGMHLASHGGVIILEELIKAIGDWELVEEKCQRAYGEHLSGFLNVTIRWDASRAKLRLSPKLGQLGSCNNWLGKISAKGER